MKRKLYEIAGRTLLYGCAAVTASLLLFLIGYILFRGTGGINWRFLSTAESVINGTVGILPAIKNTVFVIVVSLIVSLPLGVGAAVYLTEYARNRRLVSAISLPPKRWRGSRPSSTPLSASFSSARR